MGGIEKEIQWNADKDAWLRANRGIGFQRIARMIEKENYIAIIDHWNQIRYPNQRVFILKIDDYAYYVPFVEAMFNIFLKTITPSRKATKRYMRGT
jgi:hypothetical protein